MSYKNHSVCNLILLIHQMKSHLVKPHLVMQNMQAKQVNFLNEIPQNMIDLQP